jgi:hypothetical protein
MRGEDFLFPFNWGAKGGKISSIRFHTHYISLNHPRVKNEGANANWKVGGVNVVEK